MEDTAIEIKNATVKYNIASEHVDSIKEYFVKLLKRKLNYVELLAIKNLNLKIKRGESWGIIGSNGAGKSTLLKMICNVIAPSSGEVIVNGNISPMLELGSGFDPNLNAIENIYLQGALMGYKKKIMKEKMQEIIDFSELHDFLEMPVKKYSSGMYARLAFSVATAVQPDILIVDEVLSVGDASFAAKSKKKIMELIERSATLLFVSHDTGLISEICQNAVWLKKGEAVMAGKSDEVCDAYMESVG